MRVTSHGLEMVALAHVCGCCSQIRHTTTSTVAVHVSVQQQSIRISLPTSFRQLQHYQREQQQVMWMTEQIVSARMATHRH